MICTSCSKKVKDGTSVCPHCDAVLDESILGDIPDDSVDDTPIPEAPARRPVPASKKATTVARKPAPVSRPAPSAAARPAARPAAAKKPAYQNKYSQYWEEEAGDEEEDAGGAPAPAAPGKADYDTSLGSGSESDPLQQIKGLWSVFLALHFEDRLTASAAGLLVLMSFMPWRSLAEEGDAMGLLTAAGFFSVLLAVGAVLTIWARRAGKLPAVPREKMPLATIGLGGLAALICVVDAFTSYEKGVKAGRAVLVSEPSFGVFLALVCAAGVVLGGILTLKRER